MSDSEKMSALDFVISVLKEHERTLDSLIEKFDGVLKHIPEAPKRKTKARTAPEKTKPVALVKSNINVSCEEWDEFKEACMEAEAVSFQLDTELRITALHANIIYDYREPVPNRAESMGCGFPVKFKARLDPSEVSRFLSEELKVPENKIFRGEIRFSP